LIRASEVSRQTLSGAFSLSTPPYYTINSPVINIYW
jgi:hypothetical protein